MEDYDEFDDLNVVLAAAWVWAVLALVALAAGGGIAKAIAWF
jgi:hypothetical protein